MSTSRLFSLFVEAEGEALHLSEERFRLAVTASGNMATFSPKRVQDFTSRMISSFPLFKRKLEHKQLDFN